MSHPGAAESLTAESSAPSREALAVRRVLYHHRTQGKAVEGVHIRGVASALREKGTAVDVLSLPGADPYRTPKAMSPTQQATLLMRIVSRLPQPLFEIAEVLYNVVAGVRLLSYFRRHPDLTFIYERYSLFMFVTVLLARRRGLPIILEVNDSAVVHRVRPLFLQRLAGRIERWVFSRASGLVFVSSLFRDRVAAEIGPMAPAIVTPNAANIRDFSYDEQTRAATRARFGLENRVVCGYLGAFVPWHKIDEFVYRIADRLRAHPSLCLLLVGDGATFDAVARFVRERGLEQRVVLAGRVGHAEVIKLLAAMDLAVLPSAGDYTSPVKLFEFMAAGIPPIAPGFPPIREVLRDGETGWIFEAENTEDAITKVLEHCADLDRLRAVGARARAYIARERQWSNNVDQLLELHAATRGGRTRA